MKVLAALGILSFCCVRQASADITYHVNVAYNPDITGTITTDGMIGTISTGDLKTWSLTLNDGSNTFTLNEANSGGYVQGTDLSATASQLLFNFDGTGGYLFFQHPAIGANGPYACFINNATGCFHNSSFVFDPTENSDGPSNPYLSMSGTQVIASTPDGGTTLALLGLAVAGLAGLSRKLSV